MVIWSGWLDLMILVVFSNLCFYDSVICTKTKKYVILACPVVTVVIRLQSVRTSI